MGLTAALLLAVACAPAQPAACFGWWGVARAELGQVIDFMDEAPGQLALVSATSPAEAQRVVDDALRRGQRPIVMIWPMIFNGWRALKPDWRERLAALVARVDAKVAGYYIADEPFQGGARLDDLEAVAAALPAGQWVAMSLSTVELDRGVAVPRGVNLLGANLYAAAGMTPARSRAYLDRLAAYGRSMYLNLDAFRFRGRGGCSAISSADQQATVAHDEALLAWARGRSDVPLMVAFLWQSDGALCGARELPLLRRYLEGVARRAAPAASAAQAPACSRSQ